MANWLEILRWSGVVIAVGLLVICLFIIARRPLGSYASISLHLASHRGTYLLMALFLTLAGAVFYGFIWFWVIPTYQLPAIGYPLLLVSYIAQLFMSWFPASTSNRRSHAIHLGGGVIVAAAMVVILILLSLNFGELPTFSGMYVVIGTIITLVTLALYAFDRRLHKYFLIFESLFIAFFCTALIGLALMI